MEGSRVTKEASGHTPQASRGTLEGSKDTRDEGYTGGAPDKPRQAKTRQDKTVPLGNHRETIGKSLENHGKAIGKPLENHCKTTAKPFEKH